MSRPDYITWGLVSSYSCAYLMYVKDLQYVKVNHWFSNN